MRVRAGADQARGSVKLELPTGFAAEPAAIPFQIEKKGEEAEVQFQIRPPAQSAAKPTTGSLRVIAEATGTLNVTVTQLPSL